MKIKITLIILLILLVIPTFALPELDRYKYKRAISYDSINNVQGYLVNYYNKQGQKIQQEVYNEKDSIIEYKVYKYNSLGLLVKEKWFNNKNWTKDIKFVYKKRILAKKTIQYPKKETLYINYKYAYYKNRLIYKLAYYYNIDKYNTNKKLITKKTFFILKNGVKLKERYIKKPYAKKFYFQSGEVYVYDFTKRIKMIIHLDSNKEVVKCISYFYNGKNSIKKVNIYEIVDYKLKWNNLNNLEKLNKLYKLVKSNLKFKYTIIFDYKAGNSKKKADNNKKRELTNKKNLLIKKRTP